jgi:hypothetical protein
VKTLHLILSCAFVLLGCIGCSTRETNARLTGSYNGANAEMLTFQSDGGVYHRRMMHGREQRTFLGYAWASSSAAAGELSIRGPDTSAFIGTSFQMSPDCSSITVQWRSRDGIARQTVFQKPTNSGNARQIVL